MSTTAAITPTNHKPKFYPSVAPRLLEYLRMTSEYAAEQFFCVREEIALYRASMESVIDQYTEAVELWATHKDRILSRLKELSALPSPLSYDDAQEQEKLRTMKLLAEKNLLNSAIELQDRLAVLVDMVNKGSQIYSRHSSQVDLNHLSEVLDLALSSIPPEQSRAIRLQVDKVLKVNHFQTQQENPDNIIREMVGTFPLKLSHARANALNNAH